jgi:hypothetical protein
VAHSTKKSGQSQEVTPASFGGFTESLAESAHYRRASWPVELCFNSGLTRQNTAANKAIGGSVVTTAKDKIDLLVCKCKSCTHWEIGKDSIICKTCGVTFKATVKVDPHEKLHWEKHVR